MTYPTAPTHIRTIFLVPDPAAIRRRMLRAQRQYRKFAARAEQTWAKRETAITCGASYHVTSYMADNAEGLEALARLALAKFDNARTDLEVLGVKS
jgi:hypothetical protein